MTLVVAVRVALSVAVTSSTPQSGFMHKQDTDSESLPWLPSSLPWRSHLASSTRSASSRAAWLASKHSGYVGHSLDSPGNRHDYPDSRFVGRHHDHRAGHDHDLLSDRLREDADHHRHEHIGDFRDARSHHIHQDGAEYSKVNKQNHTTGENDGSHTPRRNLAERKGGFDNCEGNPETCKSMCRWLKLSTHDENFKHGVEVCPLFEWQLSACDYEPPEKRAAGSAEEPLDCALNIMRGKVLEADVEATVDELDSCLQTVPETEKSDCHFAMDLVQNEVTDFREEQALRGRAKVIKRELDAAIAEARAALESKSRVMAAMSGLSDALENAEKVPGHYLTDTIHTAREFLDELGPIVPVVDELEDSQDEGQNALEAKDAYRAEQAILRLSTAMEDAERLEIGRPLDQAERVEDSLLRLSAAEEDLNAAIIQANSSWSTVSHLGKTLDRLQHAIDVCKEIGVLDRVPEGENTFQVLLGVKTAYLDVRSAIDQGEAALTAGEGEEAAVAALREAIDAADAVDLHRDVPVASDVLHELMHLEAEKSRQQAANQESEGNSEE